MLAEGRTSCDDGIQCPVCLLLRAFLLLITKQPDALLPSVVLSLQWGVLGLRGTVMHNSIYSHPQPSADTSCFTTGNPYYFSFSSSFLTHLQAYFSSLSWHITQQLVSNSSAKHTCADILGWSGCYVFLHRKTGEGGGGACFMQSGAFLMGVRIPFLEPAPLPSDKKTCGKDYLPFLVCDAENSRSV